MQTDFEALIRKLYPAIRALVLFAFGFTASYWERSVSVKDYLLTIGGGYEPARNQVSLEANVLFFQAVVTKNIQAV